jgi:hypothetical protein
MSTSQKEKTTTSMAMIAILAAAALFGVVVVTVATIPLQEAEARVFWRGCDKHSDQAERTDGACVNKQKK